MKHSRNYILLLLTLLVSTIHADESDAYRQNVESYINANEVVCSKNHESNIEMYSHTYSNGDFMVSLFFPFINKANLVDVFLHYGNLNSKNNHDIYTQLYFYDSYNDLGKPGHVTDIVLGKGHKPLRITAVYHFESCHSKFTLDIENGQRQGVLTAPKK
jgi:hypothetical protein